MTGEARAERFAHGWPVFRDVPGQPLARPCLGRADRPFPARARGRAERSDTYGPQGGTTRRWRLGRSVRRRRLSEVEDGHLWLVTRFGNLMAAAGERRYASSRGDLRLG
jgi:hypothetical protein